MQNLLVRDAVISGQRSALDVYRSATLSVEYDPEDESL